MSQKNTLLQVCNVWWRGGSTLATLDIARLFPHFRHVVCYRHSSNFDRSVANQAQSLGVELYHLPYVTEAFMKGINPFVAIFHCPGAKHFEGTYPHSWLQNYPTIAYHRAIIHPWVPMSFEIFNSQYTSKRYSNLHRFMKGYTTIPSCINTRHYVEYSRKHSPKDLLNIGIVLNHDHTKMCENSVRIVKNFAANHSCNLRIIGDTEPFKDDLREFYAGTDILVHMLNPKWSKVETWGRIVTEALASGVYVLASRSGGVVEQLNESYAGKIILPEQIPVELDSFLYNKTSLRETREKRRLHAYMMADDDVLVRKLSPVIEKIGLQYVV